jgi:TonB family protein
MKIALALLYGLAWLPVAAQAASPARVDREPTYVAYPEEAFVNRIEGRVGVALSISASGTVEKCEVVKPVASSLDAASCAFWRRTVFRAAYDDRGQAVPSTLEKYSDWRITR